MKADVNLKLFATRRNIVGADTAKHTTTTGSRGDDLSASHSGRFNPQKAASTME